MLGEINIDIDLNGKQRNYVSTTKKLVSICEQDRGQKRDQLTIYHYLLFIRKLQLKRSKLELIKEQRRKKNCFQAEAAWIMMLVLSSPHNAKIRRGIMQVVIQDLLLDVLWNSFIYATIYTLWQTKQSLGHKSTVR